MSKLEEAKAAAKGYLKEYLEELGWKSGAPCPVCGHRGCFGVYTKAGESRWKCHSINHEGESGGDIFSLYAEINGLDPSSWEAMEAVFKKYGLDYKDLNGGRTMSGHTHTHTHTAALPPPPLPRAERQRLEEAFRKELEEAQRNIEDPAAVAYLKSRGITLELARAYGLGYVAEWVHPKARTTKGAIPSPRLIIPSGSLRYTARDIRKPEEIPEAEKNSGYYAAKKQATAYEQAEALFNEGALEEAGVWGGKPLYVVEGELDALSIIAAGGLAVGLNSVGRIEWLLKKLAELDKRLNDPLRDREGKLDAQSWEAWSPRLVIALDADKSGEKGARTLSEGLERLGVDFIRENVETLYGGSKDANSALVADAEGFSSRLATSLVEYEARKRELGKSIEESYRAERSAAGSMGEFRNSIEAEKAAIASGFPRLDLLLSGDGKSGDAGGLMAGLYVIGAPSSCGKTTFLLQVADQIAESGRDILIASLEMSRAELISKSVSRLTLKLGKAKYGAERGKELAKTNYGISKGGRYASYSEEERNLIGAALAYYEEHIAPRIFIVEGKPEGTKAKEIEALVAEHTAKTGRAPLVIVDYLQMLAAPEERLTDKQVIDRNILALKVLSRKYDTPVLAISSYNRDSYTSEASVEAMKGSGAIEYSADIVITLSYANATKAEKGDRDKGKAKAEQKEESRKPERDIKLEVLKNRNGGKGEIGYSFYALFNTFVELTPAEALAAKYK